MALKLYTEPFYSYDDLHRDIGRILIEADGHGHVYKVNVANALTQLRIELQSAKRDDMVVRVQRMIERHR